MGKVRCPECKGRGWHVGECHPREECGKCDGSGLVWDPAKFIDPVDALRQILKHEEDRLPANGSIYTVMVAGQALEGVKARVACEHRRAQRHSDVVEWCPDCGALRRRNPMAGPWAFAEHATAGKATAIMTPAELRKVRDALTALLEDG